MSKEHLLNLESLHLVDEDFTQQFNEKLAELVKDCRDRPGVSKARKLPIEVRLKPIRASSGECRAVEVELATQPKTPPVTTEVLAMKTTVHGAAKFKPDEQGTLFE